MTMLSRKILSRFNNPTTHLRLIYLLKKSTSTYTCYSFPNFVLIFGEVGKFQLSIHSHGHCRQAQLWYKVNQLGERERRVLTYTHCLIHRDGDAGPFDILQLIPLFCSNCKYHPVVSLQIQSHLQIAHKQAQYLDKMSRGLEYLDFNLYL